jgi:hypothetical protein
VILGKNSSEQ